MLYIQNIWKIRMNGISFIFKLYSRKNFNPSTIKTNHFKKRIVYKIWNYKQVGTINSNIYFIQYQLYFSLKSENNLSRYEIYLKYR